MDRRTMIAALDGDRAAKAMFVRHLKDTLRPLFGKYFDANDVDDLVHDTVRELIEKVELAPDDPGSFDLHVFGFAWTKIRATAGERKREEARALRLDEYADAPMTSMRAQMERDILRDQQWRLVQFCMLELPDIYRAAIEHNLEGGDHQSHARQAGISVVAARFRLWKGRRLLHELVVQARMSSSNSSITHQTQ